MPDGDQLTLETFAPVLGEAFTIDLGEAGALDLKLIEAEERPSSENAPRPSFALIFLGPEKPWLPQGTYVFVHPTAGSFEIFIVPTAQDDEGTRYEAIFA